MCAHLCHLSLPTVSHAQCMCLWSPGSTAAIFRCCLSYYVVSFIFILHVWMVIMRKFEQTRSLFSKITPSKSNMLQAPEPFSLTLNVCLLTHHIRLLMCSVYRRFFFFFPQLWSTFIIICNANAKRSLIPHLMSGFIMNIVVINIHRMVHPGMN